MSKPNRMMQIVNATSKLPSSVRTYALSKAFGAVVPMVGTAGLRYEHVSNNKVVVSIKNKRSMQNHIKGVHAAAMALLAETATGFVVGVNVPDHRLMVIKSLHVDYKRIAKGDLVATATLSDEQRQFIIDNEKGELIVPITVIDESGNAPIECTMNWAWLPKKKK